jgi:iron complex outermembrane recepter protein
MMKKSLRLASASVLAIVFAWPMAVMAQDATTVAKDTIGGDEIIVTAQKRSENAQDVPMSVTALSAQAMERNNVLTVFDLGRVVTNFSATRTSQVASTRLTIRGVGSPSNTATESSVAVFIDGVYVPRPGAVIGNVLDMEGVEVLRGPQGTLFGRNASVGALSFRTAQPRAEFSAALDAEYGTGSRYKLSGNVNVPLGVNLALRVAGMGQWNRGLWLNKLDGKTYGGSDDYAGRATLKAESGNLIWLVRADYSQSDGDGYGPTEFRYDTISAAQVAAFDGVQTAFSGTHTDPILFDRTVNQVMHADYKDKHWGLSSDASLELGSYALHLINSYRDWNTTQLDGDLLRTTISLARRIGEYTSKSQNHELQIISPKNELLSGRLDFVAGVYYFEERYTINERVTFYGQFCSLLLATNPALRTTCNDTLAAGGGIDGTDQDFAQTVKSFAVYSQANFKLADPLTLTLGGRWTKEEKDGTYVQKRTFPFAASLRALENVPLALDDDRFTWRTALNYRPSEDAIIFVSVSTGYKSGGFNSGAGAVALNQTRIFARETVTNYEIGAKTSWFDGALTANITFYRMDIAGYQDRSFDGVSFVARNAGNLRHQGFEFDTVIRPVRKLTLNASLAYLDSKFTNYPGGSGLPGCAAAAGVIPVVCQSLPKQGQIQDLKGTRNPYAAEWTGNVGATWTGEFGSSGLGWSLNGNVSFTSDVNNGSETDNNPQMIQPGYALINAHIAITGPDDRWTLAAFGSNLGNKGYCSEQFYQSLDRELGMRNGLFPGSTGVRCAIGTPRTYGVSAGVRF